MNTTTLLRTPVAVSLLTFIAVGCGDSRNPAPLEVQKPQQYEGSRNLSRSNAPLFAASLSSSRDDFYHLNEQERSLMLKYPSLKDCMQRARDEARAFTLEYNNGRDAFDNTRANAYLHPMWNVMIGKECGWYFSTVDALMSFIKAFTDAHEYGDPAPPSHPYEIPMDIHNNARGQEIFRYYAYYEFKNGLRRVSGPDVTFLKAVVRSKANKAVKFTDPRQLPGLTASFVYLLDG